MRTLLFFLVVGTLVASQGEEDVPLFESGNGETLLDEDDGDEEEIPHMEAPKMSSPAAAVWDHEKWTYTKPNVPLSPHVLFMETFDDGIINWKTLTSDQYAKSEWAVEDIDEDLINEKSLKMTEGMRYYGITTKLNRPWKPSNKPIYGSLEVAFAPGHQCGGGYFKLYNSNKKDIQNFDNTTPYSIMFGPDYCGFGNNHIHLILQKNQSFIDSTKAPRREEFHMSAVELPDKWRNFVHQYGFGLTPDGNYKLYVDGKVTKEGKMVEGFDGGFVSVDEIDDPEDVAPEDWTPGEPEIPDPEAKKPEDWDESQPEMIADEDSPMPEGWMEKEPLHVPNPDAQKPEGWDDEEDGEWLRPMMKNPKCSVGCGPWKPMKKNPLYKGKWSPPMIPNPDYQPQYVPRKIKNPVKYDYSKNPFGIIEAFDSIGFELWSVDGQTHFDNIFLATDEKVFTNWLEQTYEPKRKILEINEARREAAMKKAVEASAESKSTPWKSYALFVTLVVIGVTLFARKFYSKAVRKAEEGAAKKSDEPSKDAEVTPEKPEETSEIKPTEEERGTEASVTQTKPSEGEESHLTKRNRSASGRED